MCNRDGVLVEEGVRGGLDRACIVNIMILSLLQQYVTWRGPYTNIYPNEHDLDIHLDSIGYLNRHRSKRYFMYSLQAPIFLGLLFAILTNDMAKIGRIQFTCLDLI